MQRPEPFIAQKANMINKTINAANLDMRRVVVTYIRPFVEINLNERCFLHHKMTFICSGRIGQ